MSYCIERVPNNFYEGLDANAATASVLANSFLVFGFDELVGGTKGFINFPQDLLQEKVPMLLPKQRVVIEIPRAGKSYARTAVSLPAHESKRLCYGA